MTHKCCVRNCEEAVKETRSRGLPLHKFPKDVLLRTKWLTSGGFDPDFKPSSSQIVCYKHFRHSDYEIGRSHKLFLKKGSVPSVFGDYDNHPDPISPDSQLIAVRVQAREFKLSQQMLLAQVPPGQPPELDASSSCLESSTDSLDSASTSLPEPAAANSAPVPIAALALEPEAARAVVVAQPVLEERRPAGLSVESKQTRMYSRSDLTFLPGSKLEAKDFNEKWYSARVVETDWGEREVLIHFDKWSSRFDEWIPMDSSRLRMLTAAQAQAREPKPKPREFVVGERILATWVDGKKYPAKVSAALGSEKYDVLFDDGYSKVLKTSKMTKLLEAGKEDTDAAYLGSKQERRDKKRKHNVTELFQHKKRIKTEQEKLCKKPEISTPLNVKCIPKTEPITLVKTEPIPTIVPDSNPNIPSTVNVDEDYATFIGNLRVEIEDSTYKCPKTGCNKNFRKENLLQMHIKHYHPEYSKFLGSTPNVADLAYARTIGESVEDLMPKKSRIATTQLTPVTQGMLPMSPTVDSELSQPELESRIENKFSTESNTSTLEDNSSEQSNSCTMSPGTLFDMRFKEERSHTGIKTLPPVRQPSTPVVVDDVQHFSNVSNDGSKGITVIDKGKVQRKKLHQYYSDSSTKVKKQRGLSEHEESMDHFEDSLQDGDYTSELNNTTSHNTTNGKTEVENNSMVQNKNGEVMIINGEVIKVEKLRKEEIINCTCGIIEEDGLMIQCDLCLCWQHGHCNGIEREKDVPEKYVCYICQHSFRQRGSKKYFLDQDWIREGKLPSIYSYPSDFVKSNERTAILKRSHDLIAGLLQIQDLLHSLRVKVNIAQNKDHPKLYLWAKNWSKVKIPTFKTEPIPVIEMVKCENSDDIGENFADGMEFPLSIKHDPNEKLITSDTELMKILEEDTSQTEDTKSSKNPLSNNLKDEGGILLDALTKNGFDVQEQEILAKNEFNDQDSSTKQNSSNQLVNNFEKSPKSQGVPTAVGSRAPMNSLPVIPEPEAPIDPVECKLRLLEHIDNFQNYVDTTLNFIETQVSALEDMNATEKPNNNHVQSKQTIQMLLHDLETIRKLAALC